MAQMNLTPLDDVLDKHFGKVGTPKRDAFESDVDGALHAYRLGEAIKKARIEQNLTQEQLGERIGVKRAQISRLERGYSKSRSNKKRIFQKQVIMAQMNLTPLDDVLDKHFGKVGTPKRDAFESDVDGALHAYRLGEAIKKARIEQNLTQEQLGERIGVKRAQISRLERGYSITIPTMRRVFKALGVVTATIDLGIAGKVALW